MEQAMEYQVLTEKIIGCSYCVHNRMGFGFFESVYQNCLLIELRNAGLQAKKQIPINVFYEQQIVGQFVVDIIVNDLIILELKSVRQLSLAHEIQLVNYLVATRKPLGLLINFGSSKVEVRRKIRDLKNF